jgi:hypothetical protein
MKIIEGQICFSKAKLYDYQLLMWLWPVNGMIELFFGKPPPEFVDESS